MTLAAIVAVIEISLSASPQNAKSIEGEVMSTIYFQHFNQKSLGGGKNLTAFGRPSALSPLLIITRQMCCRESRLEMIKKNTWSRCPSSGDKPEMFVTRIRRIGAEPRQLVAPHSLRNIFRGGSLNFPLVVLGLSPDEQVVERTTTDLVEECPVMRQPQKNIPPLVRVADNIIIIPRGTSCH